MLIFIHHPHYIILSRSYYIGTYPYFIYFITRSQVHNSPFGKKKIIQYYSMSQICYHPSIQFYYIGSHTYKYYFLLYIFFFVCLFVCFLLSHFHNSSSQKIYPFPLFPPSFMPTHNHITRFHPVFSVTPLLSLYVCKNPE